MTKPEGFDECTAARALRPRVAACVSVCVCPAAPNLPPAVAAALKERENMRPGGSQLAEMSTLGTSLLGDSDGSRDNAAASAPAFSPSKFPLIHKVCMGVTSAMCATLPR